MLTDGIRTRSLAARVGDVYLAAVNQSYLANHWYRLEVDWGRSGTIVGKLFDSNGSTLLNQVTASTTAITSGGIAFRGKGSDKYFDTVTAAYGVNAFAVQASSPSSGMPSRGRPSPGRHCRSSTASTASRP